MEMNAPAGSNALDVGAQGVVGKPLDRVDGRLKVTGGARYAYEVEQGPTTAYGCRCGSVDRQGTNQVHRYGYGRARTGRHPGADLSKRAPTRRRHHHVAHPVLTGPQVVYYGLRVAFIVAPRLSSKPERLPTWCG